MMLHQTPPARPGRRIACSAAVALAALTLAHVSAGAAAIRFDMQGSLVRCTPVRLPLQAMTRHGLVHTIQGDRFFAPTRQAVFFFHSGDRCTWRSDRLAKG